MKRKAGGGGESPARQPAGRQPAACQPAAKPDPASIRGFVPPDPPPDWAAECERDGGFWFEGWMFDDDDNVSGPSRGWQYVRGYFWLCPVVGGQGQPRRPEAVANKEPPYYWWRLGFRKLFGAQVFSRTVGWYRDEDSIPAVSATFRPPETSSRAGQPSPSS